MSVGTQLVHVLQKLLRLCAKLQCEAPFSYYTRKGIFVERKDGKIDRIPIENTKRESGDAHSNETTHAVAFNPMFHAEGHSLTCAPQAQLLDQTNWPQWPEKQK